MEKAHSFAMDIIERPEIVFMTEILPTVQKYYLDFESKRSMIAVVSYLVGMGIKDIGAVRRVGCVMSLSVTPVKTNDPPLLICNRMNLTQYYRWWRFHVNNGDYRMKLLLPPFTSVFNSAIIKSELAKEELLFAAREMLIFHNIMNYGPGLDED